MKSFEVKGDSPDAFIAKVMTAIGGRDLGKIVSFKHASGEMSVIFSKLGTTEIKYSVDQTGEGFKAALKSEKVALAHRPFRSDIEGKLISVMKKLGARVEA